MSKRFDIFLAGENDYETEIGGYEVRVHRGAGPDQDGPYVKASRENRPSSEHVFKPSNLTMATRLKLGNLLDSIAKRLMKT
ncbi:hypothetical protein [Arthrobacter mobilis]|uniref:Uncharacterized protein n=1 Tax=Arthrobacter mobilis TaxID=2724944 RepID=A0A7X6HGV9_9MICC|nr:hypothetical protein [Arthrobacter mobilis]NKX55791.1 hypothetical protein [Arthrobacter mobilis]